MPDEIYENTTCTCGAEDISQCTCYDAGDFTGDEDDQQ